LEHKNDECVVLTEKMVFDSLKRVKVGKAGGPDKISSKVISVLKEQLTPILHKIFQQSLDECVIPTVWKTSEIIPIPKKQNPKCDNDFRPIALTSVVMKCLEHIVKQILVTQVFEQRDELQFAYREKRCVEDAVLCLIDYTLGHVDKASKAQSKQFAKILFIDFSSAFNTIQTHLLMQKLNCMNVNSRLILWIQDFLSERPQYVKVNNHCSSTLVTNTGAPQGCVLSPTLFTLYTNDCTTTDVNSRLFKYADDTALVSQCTNNDARYRQEVKNFTTWCNINCLVLNVNKTKEMIVDFSKNPSHTPLYIANEQVEVVNDYKYLGVTIVDSL
jgi:hypothetical protein